jgi:LacI family transcriptional regulator
MADVARRAGVSPSTVSHVLNATRTVSPSARAAVEQAVEETGYRPNTLARALRTSRTHTLGLAMPAITNPYLGALVRSLQGEAERAGYRLLVSDTHDDPEREELAVRDLCERQVDGLLLAPSPDPSAVLAYLSGHALPLVLVDRLVDGPYDKVGCENVEATASLTRHLAGHGHRRIAMVTGLPGLTTTEERVAGYLQGLAVAGLAPDDALLVTGASDDSHARAAVLDLLTRPAPPSALLIGNNYMTIGAVRALHELGLEAPRDVALAGFDDFEWADLFSPRLTTMAQPDAGLGLAAVRLLLERIDDRTLPPRVVRLAPRLVVRGSCGCSPAPPSPRTGAEVSTVG